MQRLVNSVQVSVETFQKSLFHRRSAKTEKSYDFDERRQSVMFQYIFIWCPHEFSQLIIPHLILQNIEANAINTPKSGIFLDQADLI